MADSHFIAPSQLRIGLHVHLDLAWTEHPFTFSSFKIKTLEQVATLQALGLDRIRYLPDKSDGEPLPFDAAAAAARPPNATLPRGLNSQHEASMRAKQGRHDSLSAYRERVAACEQELAAHARLVQSMERGLHVQPEAVRDNAAQLVGTMAESLLVDADVSIHLMADKVGGERVYLHNLNTTVLALILARELKLPGESLRALGMAALFHDTGLAELPTRLAKSEVAALNSQELAVYAQHCQQGAQWATRMNLSPEVIQAVAQHHEHLDGSGFPKRLRGAQIVRLAQLLGVVDQFDALCNPPTLAATKALTPHEALSLMYGQQRQRFDNAVLMTFVRCIGIYPPGTIVGLSNGALGMVLAVNTSRPLKPTVVVCDLSVPKAQAIVVDLEREPEVSISRTYRPEQLPVEQREYLSPRQHTAYYFSSEPELA